MASFTYTALRNIKAGHTLGASYVITIDLQSIDGDMPKAIKKTSVALSGNTVTTLHRIDRVIQVNTDYVAITGGTPDVADFDELFDSVAAGETFVYNNGTAQNVKMESDPARSRDGIYYTYRFKFRVV